MKQNEKYKKSIDEDKKHTEFQDGDLVWLHFRKDYFSLKKYAKLRPRANSLFKLVQCIGGNAYKIKLLDDHSVLTTFNIRDLSTYYEKGND